MCLTPRGIPWQIGVHSLQGIEAHLVLRDGAALVGRFQRENAASVVFYSNRAWPPPVASAVREVNASLSEQGCPRQLDCIVESGE
jgi:hypothetical protein